MTERISDVIERISDVTEKKVLVFGGTIEGRQVSDFLKQKEIPHTLCVATEYGEEVLTPAPYLEIRQGRMNVEQMRKLMRTEGFCVAVDATHPYAVEVSANIKEACGAEQLTYLRYLRPGLTEEEKKTEGESQSREKAGGSRTVYVNSTLEAAQYLEAQQGQIFLTTGSKELHIFTEQISDRSRLFARVLPMASVMEACRALGLEGKQICGMQGPFSADINEAMLRQTGARFLVTKDTGISGGFPEKEEAARRLGVQLVIIRRPQENGYAWEEIQSRLMQIVGKKIGKTTEEFCKTEESVETGSHGEEAMDGQLHRISCIGIGMGNLATLTHEAAELIQNADILFGAKRILESVRQVPGALQKTAVTEYSGKKIAEYLREHLSYRRVAILMSGDVGFYSGARGIQEAFADEKVYFCCGISSVVYFASRIPTPWQDAKLVSAHGKAFSVLNYAKRYPKLMFLVSGPEDVERICRELDEAGQAQIRVTVGSNLSYPEERIEQGAPADFVPCRTTGLHIMMLENPQACHILTPGIPDEQFIRGKVPMTKEEIRILSVAKLQLTSDAVVYDVGAGTGSVSIEIARLCTEGFVYAVERNPEGISLIRENGRRMCLSNLVTVEGTAPEALKELPVPTHAFIGGSSGNMRQIIEILLEKNPQIRIVLNTISLESIAEVLTVLKELNIEDADVVQVNTAKSKILGRYHMMNAQNPVYIIAFGGNNSVNFCRDMLQ